MHKLATAQIWVHDQDEALAFYTEKLGWSVVADVSLAELPGFRWLSVSPPGQEVAVVLMAIPGEPVFDAETREQVRTVVAKGAATALFLTTDDVHAEFERLKARGVEFHEPPGERPYGIDCAFRDPSGNHIRLAQLAEVPAAA